MKPKNKFQKLVFETSKKLPKITQKQLDWARKNCIEHIGIRSKKGIITCLECGYSWKGNGELVDTLLEHSCPNCSQNLKVMTSRKRVIKDYQYFCIITNCKGFQVIRFFYLDYYAKVGNKAQYACTEVVQRWIAPDGKNAVMARLRPMTYFADTWNFSSFLEIRPDTQTYYNINPLHIYPCQKFIPELKRTGFNKEFYGLSPFELFNILLTENKTETLLKTGQINLLTFFALRESKRINQYWSSIRICLRNQYKVEDAIIWCDYIDLLRFFNKDLHNAKYVCPADLKAEHDRYVKKKQQWHEQQRREEAKKRAIEEEMTFKKLKSKFFGIRFTDGQIQIKVLESVDEIIQEGKTLHHCVFTNNYHLKPDSLILSACINDQKLETIEFSLSQLQVLQSRGVCNRNTQYHDRILKLVKKNIPTIRKRITA